ncbi:MAG: GNAT family N-acetyltransferase [Caldilineaceae bacterium]
MADGLAAADYIGDLGSGLVRRWSTPDDVEKIALCTGIVFRHHADEPPNEAVANECRVMLSPGFPLMGPGDFAVVEDTNLPERPVVACLCCWSHRWNLGGVSFGVGRPEIVATLPAYRKRGLIRALFEMFHARSAARGEMVQAITGIEYYYRQFGYEYALDLGGSRTFAAEGVSRLKEGEVEPYTLRAATVEDVPHLQALYARLCRKSLVYAEATEANWRYYITAWDEPIVRSQAPERVGLAYRMHMVVDREGHVCGFASTASRRRTNKYAVFDLELYPGVNWQAALPSLLRAFCALGRELRPISADAPPFSELVLALGASHPAYDVLDEKLHARPDKVYAWYMRVPDVLGFVRHIAPVLERRLADSILSGYSGELKCDLYRDGLRLQFEHGDLVAAEPWTRPDYDNESELDCPPLLLLQLLFGYRSIGELEGTYPDVWVKDAATTLLLDTLFPKQRSIVWGMGYT